ncbi:hypothetical protein MRX96_019365 [Rhipicephalus microplus]
MSAAIPRVLHIRGHNDRRKKRFPPDFEAECGEVSDGRRSGRTPDDASQLLEPDGCGVLCRVLECLEVEMPERSSEGECVSDVDVLTREAHGARQGGRLPITFLRYSWRRVGLPFLPDAPQTAPRVGGRPQRSLGSIGKNWKEEPE